MSSSSNQPTYEEILRQLQEESQRRIQAEKALEEKIAATRPLLFKEALQLWHSLYSKPSTYISRKKVNASQFTSPEGRVYPQYLRPWSDFDRVHSQAWDEIVEAIDGAENPDFDSKIQYEREGARFLPDVFLRHEHHLVRYLGRTLEEHVMDIFKRIDYHITFEDKEKNPLVDLTNRIENMSLKDRPSTPPGSMQQYDKLCSIMEPQGERPVMVIEYKAAHKLTAAVFDDFDSTRTYNISSIIHRHKIATQEDERQREISEEVMAVVITQTFDYMVGQGVSYGYTTGGQAFVFLYYDPEEPQTIYYWCQSVKPDLFDNGNHDDYVGRKTAVGLVAGFARLAASRGQVQTPDWIRKQQESLPIWRVDEATMMANLTPSPAVVKPKGQRRSESPGYRGKGISILDVSERTLRSKSKMKSKVGCKDEQKIVEESSSEGHESNQDDDLMRQPSLPQVNSEQGPPLQTQSIQQNQRKPNSSKEAHEASYCTQRCLLGLVRGYKLDDRCPNVQEHRSGGGKNPFHHITIEEFHQLLGDQLSTVPRDEGFRSLGRTGWAGTFLWVRLLSHGYTFVAKGTVKILMSVLRKEGDMYRRMDVIQGKAIPVYLGNMDMRRPFILCSGVCITHLMLLSWGGEEAWRCEVDPAQLKQETARTVAQVERLGIDQGDLRAQNLLWNPYLKRVMMIDFELSKRLPKKEPGTKRMALGESSGNIGRDKRAKAELKPQQEQVKEPGQEDEQEQLKDLGQEQDQEQEQVQKQK